uniref:G_PROTEIN_RECEP_F1_2 domain-containing protein n=1 Tax=Onchocerca volvulus TaxID=6282 RepID=A0A8R1XSX6_ONCVO
MAYSCCIIALFLISPCHAGNMTNTFDIRDEYNTVKRYVAIILFSLLLLYGIVGNILLIIVFCSKNSFYSHAFILISSQLIICAFLNFTPQVIIVLFEMIKTEITEAYETTWIHSIFATMNTFSFFAMLHFTLLLAVNRFVIINMPKFSAFFESSKFYFLIVCVWISAFVISLIEFHYCFKTFNASNLQWTFNCSKITVESGAIFMKVRYFFLLSFPIAMFLVYIPIFFNIRHKRKNAIELSRTSRNGTINMVKYERLLLIQAVIICGAIGIEILCYNSLLKLALKLIGKEVAIPINIFINCYVIFNGSILPTTNLIFVKRFRHDVKRAVVNLFYKFKVTKTVSITVFPAHSTKF